MAHFHDKAPEEALRALESGPKGLSEAEARARLARWGPNRIRAERPPSSLLILARQFASPLVWVLLAAAGVSAAAGERADAAVIGAIVVLNAGIGFLQERRAERAVGALRRLLSPTARVVRDARPRELPAEELVPGDLVLLETGDRVPADGRLLESLELTTQEASLTGESLPVRKSLDVLPLAAPLADRANMVFAGTVVAEGRGRAAVTATGMATELGRIAGLLQETPPEPTPLQRRLARLGAWIGATVLAIAALVFALGVLRRDGSLTQLLLTSIALAVAAIPEGLPAMVTVGLAMGVQRMARRRAYVRRLPSAETLGACSVICSDKTGTLTRNELTVRKLWVNGETVTATGAGYAPDGAFSKRSPELDLLLRIGALNNNARLLLAEGDWSLLGDPTEGALLAAARKAGLDPDALRVEHARVAEVPFSSERKMMTTEHQGPDGRWTCVKGAPDAVLPQCARLLEKGKSRPLSGEERGRILRQAEAFASEALRVLAFAHRPPGEGRGLVFVGLQAMSDPPREGVREAIERCRSAGIRPVMITGDHMQTARAVAAELGIEGRALTGPELAELDDLEEAAEEIGVYARVNPRDKIRIVQALQARGHVVAMTGDGVNDAPALRKADLGIAMGRKGTDVAREASDLVLADDDFSTIVNAVEEGRRIDDNIQRYLAFLFAGNIGEVAVIVLAMLLGLPLPLLALQILWVNLITDGPPALALGATPPEPDVMRRPPRDPREGVFAGVVPYLTLYPALLTAGTLWLYQDALDGGPERARTVALTSLVLFQLFQALSCHSVRKPVLLAAPFSNPWLWLGMGVSLGLHAAALELPPLAEAFRVVPLPAADWLRIAALAAGGFACLELTKALRVRGRGPTPASPGPRPGARSPARPSAGRGGRARRAGARARGR